MDWNLMPGDAVKRTELHRRYGGRRQGGIAPSSQSRNILVFTGPVGHLYGYFDGWHDDGCFHYTGEGQEGDQQLRQGNRALAAHLKNGNAIRLFRGVRGTVTYVGEFKINERRPYYTTDAPDLNREIRKVIVFRLEPVGTIKGDGLPVATEEWKPETSKPECSLIDPENGATEQFVTGAIQQRTAERRESILVAAYRAYRQRRGLGPLKRLKIKPPGETQSLYSDLYDPQTSLVIEAKGTVTRDAIRMAIGQLFDYGRFVDDARLALLLPEPPRKDLQDLLRHYGISMIVSDGSDFVETLLPRPTHVIPAHP
jgi:hypothetical protein